MTSFFNKIKTLETTTEEQRQQSLIDFHEKKPKITELTWGTARTKEGLSSYQVLLNALPPLDGLSILDLACGNGPLIRQLLKQSKPLKAVGLDLCSADIEWAKKETSSEVASFVQGSAQSMPFADREFDFVLCHLALMLFEPVSAAIKEIFRILKPGGHFIAVISGLTPPPPLTLSAIGALVSLAKAESTFLKKGSWGDSRTRSREGLHSLFSNESIKTLKVEEFSVFINGTPRELASRFPDFFYSYEILSAENQELLKQQLTDLFNHHANNTHEVSIEVPMARIDVSKSL